MATRLLVSTLALLLLVGGCDHGLAPPNATQVGGIRGVITYVNTDAWPPRDSLHDLRFVALPFIPRDTSDLFRDLTSLVFSETLAFDVAIDSFRIDSVAARTYLYSGVAQQFGPNILRDWRPVGLYETNLGLFRVSPGEVTELAIRVDFKNLPPFPPQLP